MSRCEARLVELAAMLQDQSANSALLRGLAGSEGLLAGSVTIAATLHDESLFQYIRAANFVALAAHLLSTISPARSAGVQMMTTAMVMVQAPFNPRSLSSVSNHELIKEAEATEAIVKMNSDLLKDRTSERLHEEFARCQTALDAAVRTALGFKRFAAAEQAYAKLEASMPVPADILGLDMARISEGAFSTAAGEVNTLNLSYHICTLLRRMQHFFNLSILFCMPLCMHMDCHFGVRFYSSARDLALLG